MSDTSPAQDRSTHEQWIVTEPASRIISRKERRGLFIDGILVADYANYDQTWCVSVHENGNYRISRQIIVADEETAIRVCRQVAGLPAVPTPLPEWVKTALNGEAES